MQGGEYVENALLVGVVAALYENALLVGVFATPCWSIFSTRYARMSC
jgi:hypothetical protein